ncbi:glycine betaine ABC transporter substrate-binding protein [Desulfohalovibrio reitneri]|uniref:glycine betaine ABC transporter substrate-binding protein n=1 Tax=Desulfohalovibrio reitneri TaxID=1307759 RepID=UPI0004A781FB|nr:glycine betaine ABC transporter substrate-binding protein [Desulfohalovibrio reitneri]
MLRLKGIIALAALAFVLSGISQPAMAKEKTLRFGVNNWAENVAVSNMWKILLEKRGYNVELMEVGNGVMYGGVASGSLDVGLEVWLPNSDKPLVEKFGDDFDIQSAWYKGASLGLVVPSYVDVDSLDELPDNAGKFDNEIVGIDSGSSLNELTREAVKKYELDAYEFVESSEPAMLGVLQSAYEAGKPVVVTLWNPHYAFAEYDLKYLEDPKNVYGEGDDIFFITRKGFEKDFGEVLDWMNEWFMTDATLGDLIATIKRAEDPQKGAAKWIKANKDLVDSWFE